jgi:SAM-dependent methyltransferase
MSTFEDYSNYYDLLYEDKDYQSEVNYVDELIKKNSRNASTLLDLGCGTGQHNVLFEKKGYDTTGVDISREMIQRAKAQHALNFIHGDIRTIELKKQFDVVVSLFHVMSYQTANEDLSAVFKTVKKHLKKEGVFIFDCWYGPAVLSDQPVTRVKRMENEKIELIRLSESTLHANTNVVDVSFEVFIKEKKTEQTKKINELHRMRYLFFPEILQYAQNEGFEISGFEEWLTGKQPGLDTRNVVFVCKLLME